MFPPTAASAGPLLRQMRREERGGRREKLGNTLGSPRTLQQGAWLTREWAELFGKARNMKKVTSRNEIS